MANNIPEKICFWSIIENGKWQRSTLDMGEKVREYTVSFDTPGEICKGKLGYDTMTSLLGASVLWILFSAFLVFRFKI